MKTFIIAEVGPNHNGDLDNAIKYVRAISKTGCNAIKFQHGRPKDIFSNQAAFPEYQKNIKTKFESPIKNSKKRLLKDEDHIKLFKICIENKIEYMCSTFDLRSTIFINENTNIKRFKIPSGEILSLDILDYIRKFKKPIIMSTGMASDSEIQFAIEYLNFNFKKDITLLHCISSYPTKNTDINLRQIKELEKKFGLKVGLSDHTISTKIPAYSVYLDSKIIEKHVTFNKFDNGPDHKSSLEIKEFSQMIKNIKNAELIYGNIKRKFIKSEINVKNTSRKSITAKKRINKGEIITISKINFKRPGNGISPIDIEKILNKKASKNILKDDLLNWEDLK